MYLSKTEGLNRRGRSLGRCRDRVVEYMHKRGTGRGGGIEQAKWECLNRDWWSLYFCGHPPEGNSQREKGIRNYGEIDRYLGILLKLQTAYVGDK